MSVVMIIINRFDFLTFGYLLPLLSYEHSLKYEDFELEILCYHFTTQYINILIIFFYILIYNNYLVSDYIKQNKKFDTSTFI